ncbi:MAG: hypothetical protein ACTSXL_02875 [Alphaproteobacteria bacterium]|nr:MAG: hypothetical protein B6I23_02170 [Rickettsiaceae bacterium 4572_127]
MRFFAKIILVIGFSACLITSCSVIDKSNVSKKNEINIKTDSIPDELMPISIDSLPPFLCEINNDSLYYSLLFKQIPNKTTQKQVVNSMKNVKYKWLPKNVAGFCNPITKKIISNKRHFSKTNPNYSSLGHEGIHFWHLQLNLKIKGITFWGFSEAMACLNEYVLAKQGFIYKDEFKKAAEERFSSLMYWYVPKKSVQKFLGNPTVKEYFSEAEQRDASFTVDYIKYKEDVIKRDSLKLELEKTKKYSDRWGQIQIDITDLNQKIRIRLSNLTEYMYYSNRKEEIDNFFDKQK